MRPVRTAAGEDAGCGHRDGFHRDFMGIFSWENGDFTLKQGEFMGFFRINTRDFSLDF